MVRSCREKTEVFSILDRFFALLKKKLLAYVYMLFLHSFYR